MDDECLTMCICHISGCHDFSWSLAGQASEHVYTWSEKEENANHWFTVTSWSSNRKDWGMILCTTNIESHIEPNKKRLGVKQKS